MVSLNPRRAGKMQTLRVLLAGLCVLLILFIGAIQLFHTHGTDEAANPGCSLCAVAHVSVLLAPVAARPVVAEAIFLIRVRDAVLGPSRLFYFATYVRPPPALISHS